MRNIRRLPPLLRVVSILGYLFSLTAIALLIVSLVTDLLAFPHAHGVLSLVGTIGSNLFWLGLACSLVVSTYSTRFRRPDGRPFPLDSWQSQVRAIGLLSVLPLCGIALAMLTVFFPPTPPADLLVGALVAAISVLAGIVVIVAGIVYKAVKGHVTIYWKYISW